MSDIPQRLADALADRYVLEREIGAGGMATVYLARDLRHKRSVAVKVVRPELGGRDGVERFAAAFAEQGSLLIQALNSAYHWDEATSDSIVQGYAQVQRVVPRSPQFLARALAVRANVLAGMGRWREAQVLLDSLKALDSEKAMGNQAWSMALGLAPVRARFLDSLMGGFPPGPAEYAGALLHLFRGQVAEGRHRIARALVATRPGFRQKCAGSWRR